MKELVETGAEIYQRAWKEEQELAVIDIIRQKVLDGDYEYAIPHFFEEMANDDLLFADIERVIASGSMNNKKATYNYGKCHVCGEQMKEKRVNQGFWLKGKLIVVESVPAGVCPQCGEKIVKGEVGRQLATILENLKRLPKRRTMNVPVVRYEKEVA